MKTFKCNCDMGSIKIFTDSLSCFFLNDFGDGVNTVRIYPNGRKRPNDGKEHFLDGKEHFLGHFTVKTKAYLSANDCMNDAVYEFSKGRWFVNLRGNMEFIIEKIDDETHS